MYRLMKRSFTSTESVAHRASVHSIVNRERLAWKHDSCRLDCEQSTFSSRVCLCDTNGGRDGDVILRGTRT